MAAYENEYIYIRDRTCLWILDVPDEHIVWVSLERHCEGDYPSKVIFPSRDYIVNELGETPMALVRSPIKTAWAVTKCLMEPSEFGSGHGCGQ
jgi:hypothetical protein